jgi:hypothetical protein
MIFACIYLATKIEEIQFSLDHRANIEAFCKIINDEKYCTIEGKTILHYYMSIVLTTFEVFLVKAMKFELIVYTPFQLLDFMSESVREHIPTLDHKLFSEYYVANVVKAFQIEYVFFVYTPS